ncbi:MAG TPA: rhodanese-like domain-containing protein [Burkholderiales bacterium]
MNYNVALSMDFIQNNILLIAVAFASGAMLLWPLVRRSAGGPWVGTLEATQLINREDALVIDVREPAEYAKGHVLGSKNVPLGDVERRAAEFDKHKAKPVILVCESGSRSARALDALRGRGFARVVNLSGGFGAWQQAGLPVEK